MKRHLWMIPWIPTLIKFFAKEVWFVIRTKNHRGGKR